MSQVNVGGEAPASQEMPFVDRLNRAVENDWTPRRDGRPHFYVVRDKEGQAYIALLSEDENRESNIYVAREDEVRRVITEDGELTFGYLDRVGSLTRAEVDRIGIDMTTGNFPEGFAVPEEGCCFE